MRSSRHLRRKGHRVSEPNHITYEDLKTSLPCHPGGRQSSGRETLRRPCHQSGFSVVIKENPWNPWKVAGIFDARSKEEVDAAFPKIFHYGKYSAVSFDHGINIYKKIDESARGITKELLKEAVAVDVLHLKDLTRCDWIMWPVKKSSMSVKPMTSFPIM